MHYGALAPHLGRVKAEQLRAKIPVDAIVERLKGMDEAERAAICVLSASPRTVSRLTPKPWAGPAHYRGRTE